LIAAQNGFGKAKPLNMHNKKLTGAVRRHPLFHRFAGSGNPCVGSFRVAFAGAAWPRHNGALSY
jgi:hypothetical protein